MDSKKQVANVGSRKRGPQRAPKIAGRKVSIATREAMNAIEADRAKTPKDLEIIQRALGHHFIFTSLTEENV